MPVLMLHGGMMTFASSFGAMTPELARDRPVIGVEQQGHGHTPLNSTLITLEAMRPLTMNFDRDMMPGNSSQLN
ncbi:hypothetical protein KUV26_21485 [Leisingera daeponensis]|uniref:Alpha/beta hydrolase n=1 Tax=Leisingera daeponensis TaxID=405746 RepID=A0ABS7NMV4_9RHOB|nr:hypothetical protein [Leisingera daeponensis]MBY6142014.1 hypothetical protein [Leisingera daeponensis]